MFDSSSEKQKTPMCKVPFNQVMIHSDGKVSFCGNCYWRLPLFIGDLNKNTFDEIINSKAAQSIRTLVLKNDYRICDNKNCLSKENFETSYRDYLPEAEIKFDKIVNEYPSQVLFSCDSECNIHCITCRDNIYRLSDEELKILNKRIPVYLEILKNAKQVSLNHGGEVFASRHSRLLVKEIVKTYPEIKFNIYTNGLLCDAYNINELGLNGKISTVTLSLNAATKETYDICMPGSDFNRVMKNIEGIKNMLKNKEINKFFMNFVVSSKNFRELPAFIELCEQQGAQAHIWSYYDWGTQNFKADDLKITSPTHPEHSEFSEVLKSCDFSIGECYPSISIRHFLTGS